MMLSVVKIGGNVLDNPEMLSRFVEDFSQLPQPKILVHGGGKLATELSHQLGIETHMIDGRRVTDRATLDVVTMVYAGLVNKNVVARLQACHCNAIGLSGADANLIPATRRKPQPIDYGYVGDIDAKAVEAETIKKLLNAGIVPVFCALTHDGKGSMLNSNADSVASAIAKAMARHMETQLVYCFELPGVMEDVESPDTLITEINMEKYAQLRADGIISKGMIPKIDNAFAAIHDGVARVVIKHARNLTNNIGTTIKL